EEALRIAQGVPGVERVVDHLILGSPNGITPVQAAAPPGLPPPSPSPPLDGILGTPTGGPVEPMPIYQGPGLSPYDLNPPKMPPPPSPTYPPYTSFPRVASPTLYPYQAWPFIGPCYPFPKVPLGWRSIKLEWEDGHWYYGKYATPHDWWRVRYW